MNRLLALTIVVGLGFTACTPQVEPTRELVAPSKNNSATSTNPVVPLVRTTPEPKVANRISRCVSPPVASALGVDAELEAEHLNANTTPRVAVLEYLIAQIDPEYTCGTLFQQTSPGMIRSVRVYKLDEGAQQYASLGGPLQSALKDVSLLSKSSIVVLADFQGLLPKVLTKSGWSSDEVITSESLLATNRILYTRLADSNQSTFSSMVRSNKAAGDIYNCSDFSSQAAAQAFFSGLAEDVNRLDGDNDGFACEALDNASRRYQVTLADIPTTAPVAVATPSSAPSYSAPTRSYSKKCYVSGYTRKNGTRVSGYYRSC